MMPAPSEVLDALRAVIDPEIGLDLVELGLIYDVSVEPDGDGAAVHILFSLTSPACPAGAQLATEMEEVTLALDGVTAVFPRLTFDPAWTPERISEDARFALGM